MIFDLAGHLGKSIREVEQFDSVEISEWIAYQNIVGPLGPEREDLRAAIIACMIVNFSGMTKKNYKITDFMPYHKEVKKEDTPENMKKKMAIWAASFKNSKGKKK